ncbi:MAG: DsrE family protein [Chloroflexota bacterium]
MKIGLILTSDDPETAWNAIRFGVAALEGGHKVKAFLSGKGVDIETLSDQRFDVPKMMKLFLEKGGELLACGTCLKLRKRDPKVCLFSTMSDMLQIVEESDRVLTF